MNKPYASRVCILVVVLAFSQAQTAFAKNTPEDQTSPMFVDAGDDIKFENKTRRKWGAPVIADLDQDGFPELLLNDHGYAGFVRLSPDFEFHATYLI